VVLPLRVAVAATEPSADITVPKTAKRSLALAQSACSPYEWRLAVRPPKRGLESVPSGDGRLFAKLHTIFMVGHTAGIPPIVFRCHTLKKWEMLTATYLAVSAGSHQSPDTTQWEDSHESTPITPDGPALAGTRCTREGCSSYYVDIEFVLR